MKTRMGFVSNSSSASFVIPVSDELPDIVAVGKLVLAGMRAAEHGNDEHWAEWAAHIDDMERRLEAFGPRVVAEFGAVGLAFPCCNGSTEIARIGDKWVIDGTYNEEGVVAAVHGVPGALESNSGSGGRDSEAVEAFYARHGLDDSGVARCGWDFWYLAEDHRVIVGHPLPWDDSFNDRCSKDGHYGQKIAERGQRESLCLCCDRENQRVRQAQRPDFTREM